MTRRWAGMRLPGRDGDRGQAIVLVAILFVLLLGFAGLAIDVSSAYATRRSERSIADAASLAGAQDLQIPQSKNVSSGDRIRARTHALDLLVSQLGASGNGSCDPSVDSDIIDCALPGTAFHVSVRTPAPSCALSGATCDGEHALQVSVHNPSFGTIFARLFGQATWDVGITSVAGLDFTGKYAVVTLQPPKPRNNGTDANLNKDLVVSGNNTVLNVVRGDVGTNTSATTTLAGLITLADGYRIYHHDDLSTVGITWTQTDGIHPIGQFNPVLIDDPNYVYATFVNATTYNTQAAGQVSCSGLDFPTDYTSLLAGAVCYAPGVYTKEFDVGTGGGPNVAYLMPGAYSFPKGMKMHGTLAGGLISNKEGIVMVFPQNQVLAAQNALDFLVNAGSQSCNADGCRASPAVDDDGNTVQTPQGLPITIEVARDDNCFAGNTPIINGSCDVLHNNTVNLAGTGTLFIGGILYGPSDNMSINGNSAQGGVVGQLISWSVTYTGGSTLTQSYPGEIGPGVLRLESECSGPGEPCAP